jgi:hypothetical protein
MYCNELLMRDLKNILLWHDRAFKQKNDVSNSDSKTMIKIQAMIIAVEERDESHNNFDRFS